MYIIIIIILLDDKVFTSIDHGREGDVMVRCESRG